MEAKSQRNFDYVLSGFFLVLLAAPVFLFNRTDTLPLLGCYFLCFLCYLRIWKTDNIRFLLGLGILARIALFFTLPVLSDDIYRFLWDGHLLKNGFHPYAELPSFYLDKGIDGLDESFYSLLNSPNYFTIYPPINQVVFGLTAMVSDDWLVSAGVIRSLLLLADLGALYFLIKLLEQKGKSKRLAFLYFLNPLVVLEGVGNLHFEVLVVFFLVMGLYHLGNRRVLSGIGFGLAIGTKLLPLIYLPFIFIKEVLGGRFRLILSVVAVIAFSLAPLFNKEFIGGISDSLSLYFQNFEFNSSFSKLASALSLNLTEHDMIDVYGPYFAIASFISICVVTYISIQRNWMNERAMLVVLSVYLILATTVHPWYILPLLVFGIVSGHGYPLVWTLMIFVTYAGYSETGYKLWEGWILLEYLVVFLVLIFNNRLKTWLTIS